MPLFDFKCRVCGAMTEKLTTSDQKEIACGACGLPADQQIPTRTGVKFVGEGWG